MVVLPVHSTRMPAKDTCKGMIIVHKSCFCGAPVEIPHTTYAYYGPLCLLAKQGDSEHACCTCIRNPSMWPSTQKQHKYRAYFPFGLHEHPDRWPQLAAIPILVTSKANRDIKHKNFGDQRGCCHLRNLHCTLEKQDGTYENNFTAPKITMRAQVAGHSSEKTTENPEITNAEGIV